MEENLKDIATPFSDDEFRMLPCDGRPLVGTPNPFTGHLGWMAWKELFIGGSSAKGVGNAEIFVNDKSVGYMINGHCNFDPVSVKPGDLIQLGALTRPLAEYNDVEQFELRDMLPKKLQVDDKDCFYLSANPEAECESCLERKPCVEVYCEELTHHFCRDCLLRAADLLTG